MSLTTRAEIQPRRRRARPATTTAPASQQARDRGPARLFGMGRRAGGPPRRRRLQSRSLRVGRAHALRPSRRAACAGDHRSRAPHDRSVSHRSRRRGRLPDRRSGDGRREARRLDGRCRGGARRPADVRSGRRLRAQPDRMPGDSAQGARPLRSCHAGAGRAHRSPRQARTSARCARSAASTRKISPT